MIRSDFETASEIANDMNKDVQQIATAVATNVTLDERTTVQVSGQAKEVRQILNKIVNQYEVALQQMLEDIKTVAKDFEAEDQAASKAFTPPKSVIDQLNPYNDALRGEFDDPRDKNKLQ